MQPCPLLLRLARYFTVSFHSIINSPIGVRRMIAILFLVRMFLQFLQCKGETMSSHPSAYTTHQYAKFALCLFNSEFGNKCVQNYEPYLTAILRIWFTMELGVALPIQIQLKSTAPGSSLRCSRQRPLRQQVRHRLIRCYIDAENVQIKY